MVLYLQYLGLPEPSDWEGDHLLVISLWSVATLTDSRTSLARKQQRCWLAPSGARGTLGRVVCWVGGYWFRSASRGRADCAAPGGHNPPRVET